jgi:uncharacterized membrane protein
MAKPEALLGKARAHAGWFRSTWNVKVQNDSIQPENLMIPQPLHPAVVHFPIVFVVLLPIAAAIAVLAISRGLPARQTWLPVVGLAAALAAFSWLAVQTGEREEEAVEEVVVRSAIHDHEESAELFFPLTLATLALFAVGLVAGRTGRVVRVAAVVAALGLSVAGYRVGHSGGELVYEYGAASAYADAGSAQVDDDDDDDRERRERADGRSEDRH